MRKDFIPTPCYNCITLGICRPKIKHSGIDADVVWANIIHLSISCQLLYEYITPHRHYTYNIYHRRLAAHYLSGIDMGGNQEGYSISDINLLYELAKMENPYSEEITGELRSYKW